MKLGDQWIEMIDGQEHMVKVVEGPCGECDISHTCNLSVDCHMERGLIAKDLGVLKDGLLPCPICGNYPDHYHENVMHGFMCWREGSHCISNTLKESEQQAKDAWNRRA